MSKKITKEEFIRRAHEVHGDKYDYSKVEYADMKTKVCIICPEHGEFWQTPVGHTNGRHGCPKCGGGIRSNGIDFIKKARNIFNNKYDYSEVRYVNSSTKVCITCPKHGEFFQTPNGHLRGRGCPKCAKQNSAEYRSMSVGGCIEILKKENPEILKKYEITDYKKSSAPITLRCKECGKERTVHNFATLRKLKIMCTCDGHRAIKIPQLEIPTMLNGRGWDCVDYGGSSEKKSLFQCTTCGHKVETTLQQVLHYGYLCPNCNKKARRFTVKAWVNKIKQWQPDVLDVSIDAHDENVNNRSIAIATYKDGTIVKKPIVLFQNKFKGYKRLFFKTEKIDLLTQYDLLSMDWACILDLVSEDKLPKEFSQLATFAAGSKGRKKLIDELSKKYSIPESGEDADNEEEETSAEPVTNDTKIATDDEIVSATIPLPLEQTKHATAGGIMHEIDTIASIIQRGDKTTYSSGDKMKHIVAKELSKLWSQVLRDDENHSTETITEIRKQTR